MKEAMAPTISSLPVAQFADRLANIRTTLAFRSALISRVAGWTCPRRPMQLGFVISPSSYEGTSSCGAVDEIKRSTSPLGIRSPPNACLSTTLALVIFHRNHSAAIFAAKREEEHVPVAKSSIDLPRTIRRHELKQIVPLADSTIYEMEQRGDFPKRYALSPRCVVWNLAEVEQWLTERRARPIDRARAPDVRQRRSRPVKEQDRAAQRVETVEG